MEESKYDIKVIENGSKDFFPICQELEQTITCENLRENGGTLRFSGLIYRSDELLVAYKNGEPVGYNSLVRANKSLYIYQIAVKRSHQHKGVGRAMMKMAIDIAKTENLNVTAHVMEYNEASKGMFRSLGFKKLDEEKGNGLYMLKQRKLFFRKQK